MALFRAHNQLSLPAQAFSYLEPETIYLDSACQTLRPQPVIDAVDEYYREYNACGERVKYEWGIKVDAKIAAARDKLLKLAGKSGREFVCAFTLNTTYGINLLLSQLPAGRFEQMVTSVNEHNSVFLPTITWARRLGIERLVLERKADGSLDYAPDDLKKPVVVVNSTSNIDGTDLADARTLAKDVHDADGILILDGAQSIGHQPDLLKNLDFDALCFSGHKMYAPSLGVIIIRKKLLNMLSIDFVGGGMVSSVQKNSFDFIPDEPATWLEAGLQNFSGIIGLDAAVNWRQSFRSGGKSAEDYERALSSVLYETVKAVPSLTLLNHSPSPIVSFYSDRLDSHKLAIYLSAQGIMARSGYFCCHYYLDEYKHLPPLLRLSLGLNNTPEQIEKLGNILRKLVSK